MGWGGVGWDEMGWGLLMMCASGEVGGCLTERCRDFMAGWEGVGRGVVSGGWGDGGMGDGGWGMGDGGWGMGDGGWGMGDGRWERC
jgi:hypothetical protein